MDGVGGLEVGAARDEVAGREWRSRSEVSTRVFAGFWGGVGGCGGGC